MADPTTTRPPIPLLNLDTFVDRQFVRIDGEPFDIRNHDELSLVDYRRVERWGRQLDVLWALDEPTKEQEQQISHLLDLICQKVIDAPAEVHAKLTDIHRMAIAKAFTELRRPILQGTGASATEAEPAATSRPTGGS